MSQAYSIYDTKAHLSKILRKVKGGEEVVITERGVPIGKIIPFKKETTFEERFQSLVDQGIIIPRTSHTFPKGGAKRPGGLKRFLEDR